MRRITILEALQYTDIDRVDAELLLAHVLHRDRVFVRAHTEKKLTPKQRNRYFHLMRKRKNHHPLAHLVGSKEFFGREFFITKDVLVPRPETEDLVELVLKHVSSSASPRILDIGTGSGCIAITLALEIPRAYIIATDTSASALAVAEKNARHYHVTRHINFIKTSLAPSEQVPFDIIVANLPYLSPSWKHPSTQHEPKVALFAQDSGLFWYKQLIDRLPTLTHKKSQIFFELDPRNIQELKTSLQQNPLFIHVQIHNDLAGRERILSFARS